MNHIHAGHFTHREITGASVPKKLDGVFRLADTGKSRIGIEQVCNVGMGNHLQQKPRVDARRAIVDSKIDELVVKVAIEDDDVGVARAPDSCDRKFHADGIDQAEHHARRDSEWILNILVSAMNRLVRRADAHFAAENCVTEGLADAAESSDVIPKGDKPNAQARLPQAIYQTFNLGRLAGAVDAGKAYEQWARSQDVLTGP